MTGNYYPTSNNIPYLEANFDAATGNLNWRKDRVEEYSFDPWAAAATRQTGQTPEFRQALHLAAATPAMLSSRLVCAFQQTN